MGTNWDTFLYELISVLPTLPISYFIRPLRMSFSFFRRFDVAVTQLVERLLPIPEVRGSNPVIGKIYIEH